MNNLFKIVKESGINFVGSVIGMVLNYVLLIIITRFLAPEEYGTFVLAQSIINVSLIFVLLGMHKALDRFIPFYKTTGELGKVKTLINNVLKITLSLSFIIGIIFFLSSDFIANYIFKKPNLSIILKIMILSIPLLTFMQIISFTFVGLKELRYRIYIQQFAQSLLKIILGLIIFVFGYRLIGWTCMYIISLFGASFMAYYFLKKKILPFFSKIKKAPLPFKKIISYSWPLSINSIILLFLGQIDFLFLGYYRSSSEVGIYRIYIYLVTILALVLQSFAHIYKPVISELIAEKNIKEIKETYKRVSKWIFIINGLGLLTLLIFGSNIVRIFFTKSYLFAPTALYILAAGRFLNSSIGPEGMTLEGFGNTKLLMLNSLIMLGTNVGLDYFLIPRYGIVGASIATSSSITIGGLAGLIEIYVLYRMQPFTLKHIKYAGIAIFSGILIYFLSYKLNELNIVRLIGLIGLLTIIYVIGVYYSQSLDSLDYKVFGKIKAKIINFKD
ncbi:oligosaccharide flippase family protein [Candidatus Aminicenantes bacterium AC-335-K20]|jgi:O-antigen/teichoic acid export membrane protein|nr:oligosaccharide flippase family protein [SCandidatus Aminicenantes bacterium Aminicenantia_JdfR_composite]MCP2596537.1 oligosaccharide flippase family protein [Candidatus Aminicenantes bacterium AC-335-G13]MCP2605456.1 oligosaccharide flippase family protein [Candidatus Aminicenantes bacterium AC-335-O07]MCP2619249.1 oligosaccharide flippase family protein [Candidatus Aminicenantes bacterium AC-335-K20]